MTKSISLRVKPSQLARIDARASELGFDDRSKYLTAILERDLERATPEKYRLASEDLLGAYESSGLPATNAHTRRLVARRLKTAHAQHR
jgi:hypothetical protein